MGIVILILLIVAVAYLIRIERQLAEVSRIQRATTPDEVAKRLKSEELEAALYRRFIQEDFSRAELEQQERNLAFSQWKVTNS